MCICGMDKLTEVIKGDDRFIKMARGLSPMHHECPCGECIIKREAKHNKTEIETTKYLGLLFDYQNREHI